MSDSSPTAASVSDPSPSLADRMAERKKKLAELHRKRTEAATLNHREVVQEDRRNKEPKNMEAR